MTSHFAPRLFFFFLDDVRDLDTPALQTPRYAPRRCRNALSVLGEFKIHNSTPDRNCGRISMTVEAINLSEPRKTAPRRSDGGDNAEREEI